jgi:hypothetical protein
MASYELSDDSPQELLDTLRFAKGMVKHAPLNKQRKDEHLARLQRILDEIERKVEAQHEQRPDQG